MRESDTSDAELSGPIGRFLVPRAAPAPVPAAPRFPGSPSWHKPSQLHRIRGAARSVHLRSLGVARRTDAGLVLARTNLHRVPWSRLSRGGIASSGAVPAALPVTAIAFDSPGVLGVSGSRGGLVRVWDEVAQARRSRDFRAWVHDELEDGVEEADGGVDVKVDVGSDVVVDREQWLWAAAPGARQRRRRARREFDPFSATNPVRSTVMIGGK